MDLKNIANGTLTLSEINIFILGLLKQEEGFLTYGEQESIELVQQTISLIENIFKNFEFLYTEQDIINSIPTYKSLLSTNSSISKMSIDDIIQYKKKFKTIASKAKEISFKKEVLESGVDRIELTKDRFIAHLTKVFSDIPLLIDQNLFCKKKTETNILEVPLSDINLEGFLNQKNINKGIRLVQNIIEQAIQRQVDSNYSYQKINLFFLGNIINRELTKEQDFQVSQINYNLMFEFSIYLLKTYFLLKEYFPIVDYTYSLEQSAYRQLELEKEHFSNYNINFERIIPKLLISKLEQYNLESHIHDFSENSFFNMTSYTLPSTTITISYGAIKGTGRDFIKQLGLDSIEKDLIKNRGVHFSSSRVYVGSKNLYLQTDATRELRVCPSIYHLLETTQLVPVFELDQSGQELSKIWFKVTDTNKVKIDSIDIKEDIEFYDFIKQTTLSTKRDNRQLAIIQ